MDSRSRAPRTIEASLRAALIAHALPGEDEGFTGAARDAATQFVAAAAARRDAGKPALAIDSLPADGGNRLMRIALVNDDMPFLVDSIANVIAGFGLVITRLIHPILSVERDKDGMLKAILPDARTEAGDSVRGAAQESFIYIECDRADAKQRRALASGLEEALAHVRAAVTDYAAMRSALVADAGRLDGARQQNEEGAALLRWLEAEKLTLLGHELRHRDGSAAAMLGVSRVKPGKGGEPLLAQASIDAAFAWFGKHGPAPLIIKSNRISRVHRAVLIDLFLVPVREGRRIVALSIHAGLWTSAALSAPPDTVPMLRTALAALREKFHFDQGTHAGKAVAHALTSLPHDLLIAFDPTDLEAIALTFMSLADRPRPKLALVCATLGRHLYAFVWLPRDEVSTARRIAIQEMLSGAAHAPILSWSMALEEGGVALLRFTLDMRDGVMPDTARLDAALEQMLRGWVPAVEAALIAKGEPARAGAIAQRYANALPLGYRTGAGADEAAIDILAIHRLAGPQDRATRIYHNDDDPPSQLRLKLYSRDPVALSEAVPALENFGFRALDELSTPLDKGRLGHIQKFVLELQDGGDAAAVLQRAATVQDAIAQVLEGRAENDRFNALIVDTGLDPGNVVLLRAIFRYLRQTGLAYGLTTVVEALRREAGIARQLIALFHALHDPDHGDATAAQTADAAIDAALAGVAAIDEDRILRLLRAVIQATLRTNFFTAAAREAIAFKLDSTRVPGLPAPLPWREIWVYSPRVEGIHLRAGPIARGGIRWSDRRDDFRTEILGLMKAQRVKNAVIVPTGAKGGFFPKQLPNPAADREGWLAEGTESYRIFIRSLLSVTDNLAGGKVRHPAGIVIRDGNDPYFVVAADKGTASFSDIANAIAEERRYWLGDAFASGGSCGYDHKAMGITARGAWLSVQRHFAETGIDVQKQAVAVVGVGDMSGDVFGNGMLLSKAIRLIAAFDHRHIFLDPDPDPARSWKERARLFKLPRSSWDDYDKALISKGGGVFPRSQKSIPLSPEVKAALGVGDDALEPAALMSTILKSPADLLWFGGIGTYVKAARQNHVEVGDPANDRIRVDGEDVRAKVIGEGANLGVTQAGRIAYALGGGRINTDFIDNSAGVDCSDNEVNIKIALNKQVADGKLSFDARNRLLVAMTDEVAALVLEDNRLQALGLSIAEAGGTRDLATYVRLIEIFESSGRLDRAVEGLAGGQELLRRGQDGTGLTRPELAVLLSTAKLALQAAIESGALDSDPTMDPELLAAFPPEMRKRHRQAILGHQLRREIIATKVANRIVNRLGIIHPFAIAEEEGCSLADLAGAFLIVERLFDVRALWDAIDETDMAEGARLALLGQVAGGVRAQIADALRNLPAGTLPGAGTKMLAAGVGKLTAKVDALLPAEAAARVQAAAAQLAALGAPPALVDRVLALIKLDGAVGLARLAGRLDADVVGLTRAFTGLGAALGIDWVQSVAARTEPADPWDRLLISGVARDMQQVRLDFLARAKGKDAGGFVETWLKDQAARVTQYQALVARARGAPLPGVSMLAELASQARGLLGR